MKLSLWILIGIVAIFTIKSVNSNELTYADYAKLPEQSMVVISPSATKLAYRQVTDDRDMMIVLDLTTGSIIRAISIKEVNPNNVYFIDDDRLIFVVSKNSRLFGFRGRHDVSVAYSFSLESGKIYQLMTAGHGIYRGQTSLGSVVGVSSDNKYAYMPAWQSESRYSLFKVNLTKRKKPKPVMRGSADTVDFFVGKNGQLLAKERYDNKTNIHKIEAWHDDHWVSIFKEETDIQRASFVGVTPDRTKLVMIRQDGDHGRWAYFTIALKDGEISEPIFSRKDRDIETVLTDINRVVYGVRYSGFKPSYEFFDKKLNARMRGISAALPDSALTINDYTPDWSSIILHKDGGRSSGQYIRYQKGKLDLLVNARPNIKSDFVNQVQEFSYKARDGLTIPALLTLPKVESLKNLPAIMMPHGGPEAYDKIGFDWLAQYFASQGYLVIQPQFRGSNGFGTDHLYKGRGEWGRKMQDDLTDAVNVLTEEGKIDADRVCIVGASYGGYAALAGAAFTPDVYKCVVSINGVADIPSMLKGDRRKYGKSHWVVSYWDKVISNGNLEEGHLENISPINSIKNISAPVLLIHGEHDMVVPFNQSEDMFDEMKDANKQVTFIELEKGNHYLSNANNRAKALEAIDKFVKQHL
jgi:dipeptidyl aminopeptidase/acylaminoacyl peptidase